MWTLDASSGDWDFSNAGQGAVLSGWKVLNQYFKEALCTLTGQDEMNPSYGSDLEIMAGSFSSQGQIQASIRQAVAEEVSRLQSAYKQNPSAFLPSQVPLSFVVVSSAFNQWEVIVDTLGGAQSFTFSTGDTEEAS